MFWYLYPGLFFNSLKMIFLNTDDLHTLKIDPVENKLQQFYTVFKVNLNWLFYCFKVHKHVYVYIWTFQFSSVHSVRYIYRRFLNKWL